MVIHVGDTGCEKRHSFLQYNSGRGREAGAYQSEEVLKSKGHRLDMTDNTENTKQCDREVDLTSPGIMTLTSQLGLAPIPHTFFFYFHHRIEYSRLGCWPSVHFPIKVMRYGNDLWTRLTDSFCCEADALRYYYFIVQL